MAVQKHDFGPIDSDEKLEAALKYITDNSLKLARVVLDRDLAIDTVCFFTHSNEEYAFVKGVVLARGPVSELSHGPTTYVDSDFKVNGQHIRIFGVRKPDPTRPWLGYGDYPVDDYQKILESGRDNPWVKEIVSGRGRPLIELRHPDFDVLGFIVDKDEH